MSLRAFIGSLHRMGFAKDYDTKAGGERTVQFSKDHGNRHLEVQLSGDGKHRATHLLNGRMSTHPTEFNTVTGMAHAIVREQCRTDHPPAGGHNGYACAGPCNGKDAVCRYPKCIRRSSSTGSTDK